MYTGAGWAIVVVKDLREKRDIKTILQKRDKHRKRY